MTIHANSRPGYRSFFVVISFVLITLAGCGGGGGGSSASSSNPTPPTPTSKTGQVAILLTDAPTDAFCQILATVQAIDLIGSSGTPTRVFTGPETIDVLNLRNYTDVFAIAPSVPIGTYEKIRMTLSDLALVQCDAQGNPEPEAGWEHPKLPGNGKLDLNPRGSFDVIGDETMVIGLDMDMQKSLWLHQTGNGKWQFRPVIFVTIQPDHTKLVRVFGTASNVGASNFSLCPVEPVSSVGAGSHVAGTECIDVFTDASTGIFDTTGSPVGLSAVASGDLLTAIGFLSVYDNADGDTKLNNLRLDAQVLELGDQGTFERIPGDVVSAPGNNDIFVFDPTPLDDASNAIDALLQSGTRIFALGSNAPLTSAALQPGTTGQLDGVFTDPATHGEPLKTALIVLDHDTTPQVALTDATIASIPPDDDAVPETRRFTVDTATSTGQCVKTDATTRYLQITESATASETAEVTFADLAVGDAVDVFGTPDAVEPDCVLAATVQKYVTAP